jgi:hypothetical protein
MTAFKRKITDSSVAGAEQTAFRAEVHVVKTHACGCNPTGIGSSARDAAKKSCPIVKPS